MTGLNFLEENFSVPRLVFRVDILYHWLRKKTQTETYKEMMKQYGEDCCSESTVHYWREKFNSGIFSLEDEKHTGRPLEKESKDKITGLMKEDPTLSIREISRQLDIPKSSVHDYLTKYTDMEWVKERIVPSMLTEEDKKTRVEICWQMLEILKDKQEHGYVGLITGDESWIYLRSHTKGEWLEKGAEKPTAPRMKISDKKMMIVVFFSVKGIHVVHRVPEKTTLKVDEYVEDVVTPACSDARKTTGSLKLVIHHDNAPIHKGRRVEEFLDENTVHLMHQPPRSPDLAPCDYYLWGRLKTSMMGKHFNSQKEQLEYIKEFFLEIEKEELVRVFDEWVARLQWVIDNGGDYFEE